MITPRPEPGKAQAVPQDARHESMRHDTEVGLSLNFVSNDTNMDQQKVLERCECEASTPVFAGGDNDENHDALVVSKRNHALVVGE